MYVEGYGVINLFSFRLRFFMNLVLKLCRRTEQYSVRSKYLYTITRLYLVCPDVLSLAKILSRYGCGSSNRIYLVIYLYLRCKVYSYPVKQIKIILTKQPSLTSRNNNNNLCFGDHTENHLTYTDLLLDCQRQSSNSFVCR